ncbi:MAG: 1-deoxy-D-xylulose-5-phosphate reductoisomerase, partial [Ilumatobacter sp.]|nr:1-deoxy-D-xylulose-5-phosphate reductoisomerase [Ilumatobacter sp.]
MTVRVAIAGSTGSIGTQTIGVIRAENAREPGSYAVAALSAGGANIETILAQIEEFRPEVVSIAREDARREVAALTTGVLVTSDSEDIVESADVVVNSVVGFAGLEVTVE